jgi:hypothetical protein
MIGIGIGIGARRGGSVSIPALLFANGEPGAWYDPSDLSTLFQDSAGTTPVTAAGQPVGLMLDVSQGLVLGPELVTNGTFDANTTGWTLSSGSASVSSGQVTISGASTRYLTQAFATVVGQSYKLSGTIVTSGATFNAIRKADDIVASSNVVTFISTVGTGSGFFTATATTSYIVLQVNDAGACTFDNVSVRLLPGNHFTQPTAASRPTYQTDGTLHWLAFDGVDDFMVSPIITPGTNKVQMFAGVRKLSDAAAGVVFEHGPSVAANAGSAGLYAPATAAANYTFGSRGSAAKVNASYTNAAVAAPHTAILTGLGDIAGDSTILQVNGVQVAIAATDQGTGNYLAYQAYLGIRDSSAYCLNGLFYGGGVRFGPNLSAATIAQVEATLAQKSGATL